MTQTASREKEPSAFAWIFSIVLAGAGLGAAIWGATKGRRDRATGTAAPRRDLDPMNHSGRVAPGRHSAKDS